MASYITPKKKKKNQYETTREVSGKLTNEVILAQIQKTHKHT